MSSAVKIRQEPPRTPSPRPQPIGVQQLLEQLPTPVARNVYVSCKRGVDLVVATLLLIIASPAIFLAALLVKLTSRGPAFYSQVRLGRNGRPYLILKIRTMTHDCEKHSGARWATHNDPRITTVGRFLRKFHLDELPQLWNVIRGDMSLVGPRPERPEFVPGLARAIPRYGDRLLVRPGVTGLAQIQLPADSDLNSVRRKLRYDLYYVRGQSLLLDVRVLLATAVYVLRLPFGFSQKVLRVPGREMVEGSALLLPVPRGLSRPALALSDA